MTELIWEGKYDKDGNKVSPLRVRLPFQTVETVNESAQQRQRTLDLFSSGRPPEWRNRLIWGDKKYVLPSLLEEFAGQVNLIYIDPPFDTGQDFSFNAKVNGEQFLKEPSIIEQKAYRDTWGRGLESYLQWFYETVIILRDLLSDSGSIYVHLDWHIVNHAKVIMDEVFGTENFINEIIWRRTGAHSSQRSFGPIHENLLFYAKTSNYYFKVINRPYMKGHVLQRYTQDDEGQLKFTSGGNVLTGAGATSGESGKSWRGFNPSAKNRHWAIPRFLAEQMPQGFESLGILEKLDALCEAGLIEINEGAAWPTPVRFLKPNDGHPLQDIWAYQPYTEGTVHGAKEGIDADVAWLGPTDPDRTGFPTQKPEGLLRRIMNSSTKEGDLVFDCFVGSGTTASVAETLGRRWIACDLSRFAIHTTRKRLLSIPGVKPFVVQNLGKYERQLWQAAEFGEQAEQRIKAYRHFILDLYHARPITGYTWLHGIKDGRMVHVGAVDSPVSPGDVSQIAAEFKRAVGTGKDAPATNGVDVLGWDFAFELNEVAKQQAAQANINMRFLRIPREVLEKMAVEQGDIKFFELAALSIDVKKEGRTVTLTLTDFVIPPDDVPEDVRQTITNWEQWVDYWAVDWNNRDDTFHNE